MFCIVNVPWSEEIDDGIFINGENIYQLVKCCGCENVALLHSTWVSEGTDENGRPTVSTVMYPPESFRKEPRWLSDLIWSLPINNNFVEDFVKEIYVAPRNKSLRLAVMGIRALLEQVMIDKVSDNGSFKDNLDAFENAGFNSKSQRSALEPVIEAGHATTHRSFKPSWIDVTTLMDITESVIESTYINDSRASRISKRVPERTK